MSLNNCILITEFFDTFWCMVALMQARPYVGKQGGFIISPQFCISRYLLNFLLSTSKLLTTQKGILFICRNKKLDCCPRNEQPWMIAPCCYLISKIASHVRNVDMWSKNTGCFRLNVHWLYSVIWIKCTIGLQAFWWIIQHPPRNNQVFVEKRKIYFFITQYADF